MGSDRVGFDVTLGAIAVVVEGDVTEIEVETAIREALLGHKVHAGDAMIKCSTVGVRVTRRTHALHRLRGEGSETDR